jgi:hypothetical protein
MQKIVAISRFLGLRKKQENVWEIKKLWERTLAPGA